MKHTTVFLAILLCLFLMMQERASAQEQSSPEGVPPVSYLKADPSSPYPFSDAVRVGHMLYLSGAIGTDSTGKVVPGGITAETRQVMENIRRTLTRYGSSLDQVVKCTVMLADIAEWPAMNSVYRTYFTAGRFPARSAFAGTGLALGARVEIECWAFVK
jgi:reactive intermediate/imine deaminase